MNERFQYTKAHEKSLEGIIWPERDKALAMALQTRDRELSDLRRHLPIRERQQRVGRCLSRIVTDSTFLHALHFGDIWKCHCVK